MDQQLPAGHDARLVEEEVNRLDLRVLEDTYGGVGSRAYLPSLLLKIVLFELLRGRTSPAMWHRDSQENSPLRWLGRGIQPSRSVWYTVWDRMANVIESLHEKLVQATVSEELVTPQIGALDGTVVRSQASRHRVVNRATLVRRQEILEARIQSDQVAAPPPPATQVPPPDPNWMAQTPEGRRRQATRFQQALLVLEERLVENARKPKDKRLAEKRVQVSVSDLDAPLGRDKEKVFGPVYNVQCMAEPHSGLILSWGVFCQATDTGTLLPMIDRTRQILGYDLDHILADAAYATLLDLQGCQVRNVDLIAPVQANSFTNSKRAASADSKIGRQQFTWSSAETTYYCPQGHKLTFQGKERKRRRGDQFVVENIFRCPPAHCQACPLAARCVSNPNKGRIVKRLEGQDILDGQRQKMEQPEATALYKLRSSGIERIHADSKQHRQLRRLNVRGVRRTLAQIGLVILAQTIQTCHRLRKAREKPVLNTT